MSLTLYCQCTLFSWHIHVSEWIYTLLMWSWMSRNSLLETSPIPDIFLSLIFPFWTSRCFLPWESNSISNRGVSSNNPFFYISNKIWCKGCVHHAGVGIIIYSIFIGLSDLVLKLLYSIRWSQTWGDVDTDWM